MKHILFVTDNFFPEVNAPASRTFEHCREWVKHGHQVTVITGVPNFPAGRAYDGYTNRLWQSETIDGIRVLRVWTYITANEGFLKRTMDYLSFMMSAFMAGLFVRRVDVVIGTSPQFFTVCAAYVLGRIKRVPWVFELRDIWPESIRVVGAMKSSRVFDVLERLELYLYREADVIVSVTHSFRESLARRGIGRDKIHVVTNGVDLSRFSPREKDAALLQSLQLKDKFVAGYIGTHGMAHALGTVLDAAKILQSLPDGDWYRILLLGNGANKAQLIERARQENIDNVLFVDSVAKEQVARYWSLLDASIIHLKRDKLFATVIPSKLFEAMGMAVPVLVGVEGETAEIVAREDVGLPFTPESAEALVESIRRLGNDSELYRRFQANGLLAAQKYDRAALARELLAIIERETSEPEKRPSISR